MPRRGRKEATAMKKPEKRIFIHAEVENNGVRISSAGTPMENILLASTVYMQTLNKLFGENTEKYLQEEGIEMLHDTLRELRGCRAESTQIDLDAIEAALGESGQEGV